MKRFLAIALLVTASAQANDIHDMWMNWGKNSRIASGVKTLFTGIGIAASGDIVVDQLPKVSSALTALVDSRGGWKQTKVAAKHTVIAGSTAYFGIKLFYYYFPEHAKHALGIKNGWFS